MPNGVIRMSDDVEGVVETSLNAGVVSIVDDKVEILCLIRSLIDSGKTYVVSMLTALAKLAKADIETKGGYPGWKPDADSPVMHLVRDTYQQLFDKVPNIMVIHAGLECGLFKNLTQIWIWFLLDQQSVVLTHQTNAFTLKALVNTGSY